MMALEFLLPILSILTIIFDFISALIVPVIEFLFGLGEVMFAKIFFICVLSFFIYKAAIKLIHSPAWAFIASLGISLIGIRAVPEDFLVSAMTGWYAFAILALFFAFTLFLRTVWWQRRATMFALIILFSAFWYFYGRSSKYVILAIILLIFLILDSPIHKALAPLRKSGERKEEIDAQIALKEKEINNMLAAGIKEGSSAIKSRRADIDELINEKSKI